MRTATIFKAAKMVLLLALVVALSLLAYQNYPQGGLGEAGPGAVHPVVVVDFP